MHITEYIHALYTDIKLLHSVTATLVHCEGLRVAWIQKIQMDSITWWHRTLGYMFVYLGTERPFHTAFAELQLTVFNRQCVIWHTSSVNHPHTEHNKNFNKYTTVTKKRYLHISSNKHIPVTKFTQNRAQHTVLTTFPTK